MTLKELYRAERLPVLQNRVFDTPADALACARGDVVLVQDEESGLIRNRAFSPELMHYDRNYQNEQAESPIFRAHLQNVARLVMKHFDGSSLIEVGCGKARFLEQLQELGFQITGWDPAYEGSNPAIRKEYFTPASRSRADGIILRHVLEHIPDPVAFLTQIRDANGGSGDIYIEVPCFDWIRKNRAWFDIFYEHVNYFRLPDFDRIFGTVHESGHTFGGQYLYVVADLASIRKPSAVPHDAVALPADFRRSIEVHARRIAERGPAASIVWGAASKGVIFSLFMQQAGAEVGAVIDINPVKQGKYLPATGLQVQPPAAVHALPAGADIYVMNGNYLAEIREMAGRGFNFITVDHALQ